MQSASFCGVLSWACGGLRVSVQPHFALIAGDWVQETEKGAFSVQEQESEKNLKLGFCVMRRVKRNTPTEKIYQL